MQSHDHDNLEWSESLESHLSATISKVEEFRHEDEGRETDLDSEEDFFGFSNPYERRLIIARFVKQALESESLTSSIEAHEG